MKHTIKFKDHGQDFLEWDVKDGVVVACRPFQAWAWKRTKVDMTKAKEGQLLPIITTSGEAMTIKHPIAEIRKER